jgi:Flp pilus assembly protein TadD
VTRQAAVGLAVALVLALLAGCATLSRTDPPAISPAMLIAGQPLTGGVEPPPLPEADILGLDADMRRFIAERVASTGKSRWRLRDLLRALLDDADFVIEYQERTYTAAEAFRLRRANCLAFTNLFVALAREAGLTVHYQEVDIPPDWSVNGAALMLSRHINTLVDTGEQGEVVVDFNIADFRSSYDRRVISDARAQAHYYSNVGVERMGAGEPVLALQNFRKALAAEPAFVPAWINLAALYQRAGHGEWAEAAWRQALTVDPREYVAMSNLERRYRSTGRLAQADELQGRIRWHRRQNPYYRYQLAEAAFAAADYDEAIGHLRFAISSKPNEDRFYALMGFAYLRRGDISSAQRWLARAGEVAGDEKLKERYNGKLELLRRSQEILSPVGS